MGNLEDEYAAALQAAEQAPDMAEAHKNLGVALIRKGDRDGGEKAISKALELSPDYTEAVMAMAFLRMTQQRLSEAEACLLKARDMDPGHQAAAVNLGMIYRRQGRFEEAVQILEKSLAKEPDSPEANNNLALAHIDAGRPDLAEPYLRKAAGLDSENMKYRFNLIAFLRKQCRFTEAAEIALEAHEKAPMNAELIGLLPSVLVKAGYLDKALEVGQRLVEMVPDFPGGHYNQALTLMMMEDFKAAEEKAIRAIALDPGFTDAYVCLAQVRLRLDRPEDALEPAQKALEMKPSLISHFIMGKTMKLLGRIDEAVAHFRVCVRLDPDEDLGAGVFLAALTGKEPPERASRVYVRKLFDQYADRYDTHLVERLHYRGPQIIERKLTQWCGRETGLRILDLGCGTGLCAPVLKPLARELIGVDLSGRMIEKARSLDLYDELATAEARAYLESADKGIDCIVAADVMVYVGALEPILKAARAVLTPGGLFLMTTERGEGEGYRLGGNGRYAHSETYVRSAAGAAGFEVLEISGVQVRTERKTPVPSLAAVLRAG